MITWVVVWVLTVTPYKSGSYQLSFETKQECLDAYAFHKKKHYALADVASCTKTKTPMVVK